MQQLVQPVERTTTANISSITINGSSFYTLDVNRPQRHQPKPTPKLSLRDRGKGSFVLVGFGQLKAAWWRLGSSRFTLPIAASIYLSKSI